MQNWIHKPKFDLLFILSPPFVIALIVALFQKDLEILQNKYSFWTWLFLIVFIDVAHVYSSLFKTYLNPKNFRINKKLFTIVPIICFTVSCILFYINSKLFWSVLAYIAVFHFIRQQYGFMKLYARKELRNKFQKILDEVVIYTATLYPMIYWFSTKNLNFNWFINDEFIFIKSSWVLNLAQLLYYFVLMVYFLNLVYLLALKKINIPKHLLIIGTIISWYLGIVYYNNDLIFTLFNVVSHGLPYMALIFVTTVNNNKKAFACIGLNNFKTYILFYVLFLLGLSFLEEIIWELTHWQENFNFTEEFVVSTKYLWIWIPLLALPQLTHYILDGFIWKNKK